MAAHQGDAGDQLGSWVRLASKHARRHGTQSPDPGEDSTLRLGTCWLPTRWLGEGSTVMANAERVKDAAEAYRYGYRQHGGHDGMTVVPPRPECSPSSGGSRGARKGNHFAAWEQPQLFTEEVRTAFRSLR
jgi:hypothetical protein